MKKYIIFLIFINYFSTFSQALPISSPINRSVYQRNSNSNTATSTVTFAGQVSEGVNLLGAIKNDSRIEIKRLLLNGNAVGDYLVSRAFTSTEKTRIGTSRGYTFYLTLNVPTGWYQLNIKNGSNSIINSVKFGVGEVFIIAGQSNAQGYGNGVFNLSSGLQNYDCVESFKNIQATDLTDGGTAYVSDFVNLERPVFGVLNTSNPNIAPNATRPWFYQSLGEKIAVMHNSTNAVTNANYTTNPPVPTLFFNVASAASSINNWEGASQKTAGMFSNNYSSGLVTSNGSVNPANEYPSGHPWGFSVNYSLLFTNLKNMLSFYGGMYGIRAVLWHQGEAETKTLVNPIPPATGIYTLEGTVPANYLISNYDTKLKAIINKSRLILPNLNWGISKVSLTSEAYKTPPSSSPRNYNMVTPSLITEQASLINSSNPYIGWFTQLSDSYTNPTFRNSGDGTHFNEAGLANIATDAYNNILTTLFNKSPVLPTPLPKLSLTKVNTGVYNVSIIAPSGVSYVHSQWSNSAGYFNQKYNQANGSNSFTSSSINGASPPLVYGLISGFLKDSQGRISIIPYVDTYFTGARIAVEEISSIAYPNPLVNNADLTVEFDQMDEGPATIVVYDKNENLLYSVEKQENQIGKNTHVIPYEVFKNTEDLEFLYVLIKSGEQVSKKKIIIQK